MIRLMNPPHWPAPKGYSNAVVARGDLIFLAGQIGWKDGVFIEKGLVGQLRQTLINIREALEAADAKLTDIARMTWFVTERTEYVANLKEIGAVYREVVGKHFPAMSVIEVKGLLEAEAKIEIEATAVVSRP
ncbi:MAG: RidA family protein [Rhodospirillaceae bacterium]|nr:RidA family protein [Rhodospirillaceae bacterium]